MKQWLLKCNKLYSIYALLKKFTSICVTSNLKRPEEKKIDAAYYVFKKYITIDI